MATSIEKVQLLIGDTTATQFTVAQIQTFLDMASNSVLLAASYALEAWAAAVTDNVTTERIGDYSYAKNAAASKTALAKKYRDEDASTPAFEWSEMDLTGGSSITAEGD